jgi:peptidoglycan/xylan/chitin deacetylase (PgdA/CDA1 family)
MTVSADNFGDQMEWLAKHRAVLPFVQFARAHQKGELPADAVAITFDDGSGRS